ncbi:MAG: hypothetical protein WBC05_08675 [Sedimentisphaerales bacterium]
MLPIILGIVSGIFVGAILVYFAVDYASKKRWMKFDNEFDFPEEM